MKVKTRKKIVVVILILIIIIPLIIIILPVNKNNKYQDKLISNVYNNTDIKKIKYINKDNNYYIVKTKDKIIVLDLNYEEVYKVNISDIKENNLELVYRRNKLYYEKKKRKNNKLTYTFYDVTTNEEAYKTVLGGK